MANTDPVVRSKRVFKDAADKARQKRLEGKDTPFQRRLRLAESRGENPFPFKGKSFAARTTVTAPPTVRATSPPGKLTKPPIGTIPPLKQGFPSTGPAIAPVPELPVIDKKIRVRGRNSNSIPGIVNNRRLKRVSVTGERPGKRKSSGRGRGSQGKRIKN